jgi:hypothetical protein
MQALEETQLCCINDIHHAFLLCYYCALHIITLVHGGYLILMVGFCQHWILGIVQLYQAFVVNGTSLLGPALYYSDVKNPLQLTRITLYVGCTVLIDLLLVSIT